MDPRRCRVLSRPNLCPSGTLRASVAIKLSDLGPLLWREGRLGRNQEATAGLSGKGGIDEDSDGSSGDRPKIRRREVGDDSSLLIRRSVKASSSSASSPASRKMLLSRERSLARERKQHTIELVWNTLVILLTTFAVASFVVADLCQGGLGTSNGRMVSFLNSLNSVASYRRQRRVLVYGNVSTSPVSERRRSEVLYVRSPRNCLAHRIKLFCLNFMAKFGSQSLGSVIIGATPVILKGPRHMASWLLAFACIQLCPRDSVYLKLQAHAHLLLVVRVGCALYKLRKFNFVAKFALDRAQSFKWMLAAQIVVIDGNNLCSRIWTWTWLRGYSTTTAADIANGLAALLARCGPVALASCLVYSCSGGATGLAANPFVPIAIKLTVFALFLWRYDVPNLGLKAFRHLATARRKKGGFQTPKRDLTVHRGPDRALACWTDLFDVAADDHYALKAD